MLTRSSRLLNQQVCTTGHAITPYRMHELSLATLTMSVACIAQGNEETFTLLLTTRSEPRPATLLDRPNGIATVHHLLDPFRLCAAATRMKAGCVILVDKQLVCSDFLQGKIAGLSHADNKWPR